MALVRMGTVRIGTLHDFRRTEHKNGIADPSEGKKKVSHYIDHLHVKEPNDPNARQIEKFGIFRFEAPDITIQNINIVRAFDHPDCYVFCMSSSLSKKTMNKFEGADSCTRITDVVGFFRELTVALNSITPVIFKGVHTVVYQDRKEKWNGRDWGRHPALIKEREFIDQKEMRTIWQPRFGQAISPMITGNHRLAQYCEEVQLV